MKKSRKFSALSAAVAVSLLLATGGVHAQDDVQAKVNAGWTSLQNGKLAEARAAFQSVLDAAPNYDFGWYALGQVATREGKTAEALEHFKRATEINADKFEYHYGMAAAYRTSEEYAKAIATLNNAEPLANTTQYKYLLHLERGLSYSSAGQFDRATADLEAAVKAQPGQKMATQRLGISLYGLQDYDGAVTHLRTAAAADPRDSSTQVYLARSLINMAQREQNKAKKDALYAEAQQAAELANTLRPGTDQMIVLGKAQLGAGAYDKAAQSFQKVVKDKPGYCYGHINLGSAYLGMKAWGPAAEALEAASKCDQKNTTTLNLLAFSHVKLGNRDKALEFYEKSYAMKADPLVADHMSRVKQNLEIAAENAATDAFNAEQVAQQQAEKEEFERRKAAFEAEQKKIKEFEERDQ